MTGRQFHFARHHRLRIADDRYEVTAAHVDVNPSGEPRILAFEHGRAVDDAHRRDRRQRQLRAALGDDRQHAQRFHRVAYLARIADADRKTGETFDGLADVLAADRGADRLLQLRDVETKA